LVTGDVPNVFAQIEGQNDCDDGHHQRADQLLAARDRKDLQRLEARRKREE